MKIAFVGKGGSGKSTLTALYLRYLQQQGGRQILAIDADLNMNLAGQLGVQADPHYVLANPYVAADIRKYLMGSNTRIGHIDMFLPTTPPAEGSNLITASDNAIFMPYAAKVKQDPAFNLLTVGTYDAEGIGQTCYHSHLFVAENMLSHTVTNDNFAVVCDMVAGTDAFAYSLHLQFDAIILICEPTPESAEVCRLYIDLARQSGIESLIQVIGNKVEDEDDKQFIRKITGVEPVGFLPVLKTLKKARQNGAAITADMLDTNMQQIFAHITNAAQNPHLSAAWRMQKLCDLHAKLNDKKWVQLAYGDVMGQIDPNFINNETSEAA